MTAGRLQSAGLTGKWRHRTLLRVFRAPLVVMQVEETVFNLQTNHHTIWRDATPDDLMRIPFNGKLEIEDPK